MKTILETGCAALLRTRINSCIKNAPAFDDNKVKGYFIDFDVLV